MNNITIEIYPDFSERTIHVFKSAPKFGNAPEPAKGGKQYGTLSDGHNRVKFAVFNATLSIDTIKSLARIAVNGGIQKWNTVNHLN